MQAHIHSDKHKTGKLIQLDPLRQMAEERLPKTDPKKSRPQVNILDATENARLLHELQVHQIELEIQNEELRRTQCALEESLARYVNLYDFAPVGYLTLAEDGAIVEANLKSADALGELRNHLLKKRFPRFIAPDDADRWSKHFSQLKREGNSNSCDLKMLRADGTVFYAHLDCLVLASECANAGCSNAQKPTKVSTESEAPAVRVTMTDVTNIKMAEQELRVAATVFESQEGMMITDPARRILKVNHAFTHITGYTPEDVVGSTPYKLRSGRHDEAFYDEMWTRVCTMGAWQGEVWNRKKNDEIFPAWLTITVVKNTRDEITHYVATIIDISSRKATEEEMQLLAFYDPLTRLPNRRLMLDRLQRAIPASARTRKHCALMFIDLDKFKEINDSLGHDIGDMLLQLVAQRLSICVREGDTVARMGGDEFMVMLENLAESTHEAEVMVEAIGKKILAALSETFRLGGHECASSASIGITLFIGHSYSISELQKQADLAMYEAKSNGRNQLCFFRPGVHLFHLNDPQADRVL